MKRRIIRATSVLAMGAVIVTSAFTASAGYNSYSKATAGVTDAVTTNVNGTVADLDSSRKTAGVVNDVSVSLDSVTVVQSEEETVAIPAEPDFGYENLGVCNIDEGNLNVRETPSQDGKLCGKLPKNAGCEVLGGENGWYQIKSGDVKGYVLSDYILTGEDAKNLALQVATNMIKVTGDALRVRTGPSTDDSIMTLIGQGTTLEVVEDMGDWIKVSIDDEEGFVCADYVNVFLGLEDAMTLSEARYGAGISDVRADLVNYAVQFCGNPYVWGGESLTKGADCSGFVLKIFQKYGIYLPHSSRAQAGYGTRINASDAKPGDVFFYGKGNSISHVAIYIGNGQIVHASSRKTGIKISSAYYRNPICVINLLGD